jgi:hypothetical protein
MMPSLAGQDRSYLIGQLRAFREQRRRHAAMEGVLAKLIDGDLMYDGEPGRAGGQAGALPVLTVKSPTDLSVLV